MAKVGKHEVIHLDGHAFYRQGTGYYRNIPMQCSLHRYVWEKANNRRVPSGHSVHHIDGNRDNNDPANLTLLDNRSHGKLHGRPKGTGKGRGRCSAPGCDREVVGRGMCTKHWGMVRRLELGYPQRTWHGPDREADRHFQAVIAPALAGTFDKPHWRHLAHRTAAPHNRVEPRCPRGHEYDILVGRDKRRGCSVCKREYQVAYRATANAKRRERYRLRIGEFASRPPRRDALPPHSRGILAQPPARPGAPHRRRM